MIAKYFSRSISAITFATPYFNVGNIISLEDFKALLKNNILIFDDFERSKINIVELLGYLSNFIEQQHLHVIIISDETKIICSEYPKRKEKIIGKTLQLESSDTTILPAILNNISNECIRRHAIAQCDEICDLIHQVNTFKNKNRTNYRAVKNVIQEFSFTFSKIIESFHQSPHAQKIFFDLFNRFFTVSYSLMLNKLPIKSIADIICFGNAINPDSPEYKARDEFLRKFIVWRSDYFIPIELWDDIFNNRLVSSVKIIDCIEKHINPQKENWFLLWHYFEMNDEEIKKSLSITYIDIKNRKYKLPVEIIHVFSTLLEMSRDGFLNKTIAEIVSEAEKYVDEIESKMQYDDSISGMRDLLEFNGSGLGIYSPNSKEVKLISEKIMKAHEKKDLENKKVLYEKMLTLFTDDTSSLKEWAFSDSRYKDIFSSQNPELFWNTWIVLHPRAFRQIGHWFETRIIGEQLYSRRKTQKDFWVYLLNKAKEIIATHNHSKIDKSKTFYLEKNFIPNVEKLLFPEDAPNSDDEH